MTEAQKRANKKYRKKNQKRINELSREWEKRNPEARRNVKLRQRYGISLEIYNKMVNEQQNKCKICEKLSNKRLQVDHCHITGKIRGLLCDKCNRGIGHFLDNENLLQKAASYIKEYNGYQNELLSK